MGRLIRSLLFIWAVSSSCQSWCTPYFSDKFDDAIQIAVRKYWGDFPDYKYWKSQLFQESRLDPNACSSVGACGLAQFMGPTWIDVSRQIGYDPSASRFNARLAIEAGAYYQAKLRTSWRAEGRASVQRNDLGLCAYNAGLGSCLKAQSLCRDSVLWEQISPCLPSVTGQHAVETMGYVRSINHWRAMMN